MSDTEMERIIALELLELEEGSLIWHCKNYFLFSYYCAGIHAADLIQLRWGNVFAKKQSSVTATEDSGATKEEQAIELLKGMTPEQIMAVISAINK